MRSECVGFDLIGQRRHRRLLAARGELEEQAFLGVFGDDGGAAFAPFEDRFDGLDVQFALGNANVVTGEAVRFENRIDVLLEIDGPAQSDRCRHDRVLIFAGSAPCAPASATETKRPEHNAANPVCREDRMELLK